MKVQTALGLCKRFYFWEKAFCISVDDWEFHVWKHRWMKSQNIGEKQRYEVQKLTRKHPSFFHARVFTPAKMERFVCHDWRQAYFPWEASEARSDPCHVADSDRGDHRIFAACFTSWGEGSWNPIIFLPGLRPDIPRWLGRNSEPSTVVLTFFFVGWIIDEFFPFLQDIEGAVSDEETHVFLQSFLSYYRCQRPFIKKHPNIALMVADHR